MKKIARTIITVSFASFCTFTLTSSLAFAQRGATLADSQEDRAVAYCWKNKTGYYFCHGPTQITSAGEDKDNALKYSGCYTPEPQQYEQSSHGICRGIWYICTDQKLETYHNNEERIRKWLSSKKC